MRMKAVVGATVAAVTLAAAAAGAVGEQERFVEGAKKGNRKAVLALLTAVDVNLPEPDGMTALHWAARRDDVDMARALIRAGADVNATTRYGIAPLALAATNGSTAMLDVLLAAGGDPDAALPSGETVLMAAARAGDPAAVAMLVRHGADVNARESTQGQTALMWAAAENNEEAAQVLAEAGAELDVQTEALNYPLFKWTLNGMVSSALPQGRWTALMYAARQDAREAVRALVDAGADLDVQDGEGTTALVLAIVNAHFDLAAELIERGADLNIPDETGMTPLYAAIDMHTLGPMLARPKLKLEDTRDPADVAELLLARGANPNARLGKPILGRHHGAGDTTLGEGATPLMRAAKRSDLRLMQALLDAGADATITQSDFTDALMLAAGGGRGAVAYDIRPFDVTEETEVEAVELLLRHGADPAAFNTSGMTALHFAAGRGADAIVKLLAERGARLRLANKLGLTPLDMALGLAPRARGEAEVHEETAALLRSLLGAGGNDADAR